MDQQHLLEVFELWDGIVTVPHRLATFLSHDALRVVQDHMVKYAK